MMGKGVFRLCSGGVVLFSMMGCTSLLKMRQPASPSLDEFQAELSSQEVMDGSVLIVSLRGRPEAPEVQDIVGEFENIRFPFFTNPSLGGYQAVLGIPFNHPLGSAMIQIHFLVGSEKKSLSLPFQIKDGHYPYEQLRVDSRKVNPRKSDLIRIQREMTEVRKIYETVTLEKFWEGPFALPVNSQVTSVFGTRRLLNGVMQSFHQGLDLRASVGTPIHPAAAGRVVLAKNLFFSGHTILIDHGYGVFTLYAHMSKLSVKVGQKVDRQTLLGLSGKTGRVAGPHLHWGAIIHQARVNPEELMRVMPR